ncbi:MAG: hypothetical protein PHC70_03375 [Patescibacteria group bacterium]|jgi:hypothetical protein|nr:hypothetical protein [Patescibacteria group bacterium]
MSKSSAEVKLILVKGDPIVTRVTINSGVMLAEILKAAEIPKGDYSCFVDGAPANRESRINFQGSSGSPIVIKVYELERSATSG